MRFCLEGKEGTAVQEERNKPNYQVRSVSRALQILKCYSPNHLELSLSELNEMTSLNKSTLIRLLDCLIQEGFIEQNPVNAKYHLGMAIFEIGMVFYVGQLRISQLAKPFMASLAHDVSLTVNLAILDEDEIVYIGIEEPNTVIRVRFSLGSRFKASVTGMGKMLLSQLSEEKIDEVILKSGLPKATKNTITDPAEFKAHLLKVKEQGYAIDNEEALIGVRCMAMPIYDYSGKVIAAISVSGAAFDFLPERDETVRAALRKTVTAISEKLGYQLNFSHF